MTCLNCALRVVRENKVRAKARLMRERNILYALLALNLALLFAFCSYLALSLHETAGERVPAPRATPQTVPTAPNPVPANPSVLEMAAVGRVFTFRDVETTNYAAYLATLKRAGCPDQHVRHIVLADVEEHFAAKRLQEAIRHDFEWWRADSQPIMAGLLREKGMELAEQQQKLAMRLLGGPAPLGAQFWTHVPLTGAVLGALSEVMHLQVQEICGQRMTSTTADPAQAVNPVAAARVRELLRAELARVLSPEQLEEFLIRYSQHAVILRQELRVLQPTADEFRRTFSVLEPIDRELQIEFGAMDALAEAQRERYQRRRTEALQQVLAPERYAAYLLARNEIR